MSLERFADGDAEQIATWARTYEEALGWCSMTDVPVPPEVVIGWARDAATEAYVMRERGRIVAYGEIWIDETEVELGHLIVDPACRNDGIGRALTAALADIGRSHRDEIYLRVMPDNIAAQRCYESAGFTRVDATREASWNVGQPRTYVWMTAGPEPQAVDRVYVRGTRQSERRQLCLTFPPSPTSQSRSMTWPSVLLGTNASSALDRCSTKTPTTGSITPCS